ncbi:hypothetical protein LIER_35757 [Lithospermum erythrorhizon]|uniref:Uncharacterized protein n=1 Tax=Lithospermum erythrorhizon TaxID=34254 RepID=A0AAV3NVT2_LITER
MDEARFDYDFTQMGLKVIEDILVTNRAANAKILNVNPSLVDVDEQLLARYRKGLLVGLGDDISNYVRKFANDNVVKTVTTKNSAKGKSYNSLLSKLILSEIIEIIKSGSKVQITDGHSVALWISFGLKSSPAKDFAAKLKAPMTDKFLFRLAEKKEAEVEKQVSDFIETQKSKQLKKELNEVHLIREKLQKMKSETKIKQQRVQELRIEVEKILMLDGKKEGKEDKEGKQQENEILLYEEKEEKEEKQEAKGILLYEEKEEKDEKQEAKGILLYEELDVYSAEVNQWLKLPKRRLDVCPEMVKDYAVQIL